MAEKPTVRSECGHKLIWLSETVAYCDQYEAHRINDGTGYECLWIWGPLSQDSFALFREMTNPAVFQVLKTFGKSKDFLDHLDECELEAAQYAIGRSSWPAVLAAFRAAKSAVAAIDGRGTGDG